MEIFKYFESFIHFLRFLYPKNHPKNYHSSLKKVWHNTNLFSLFEIHVKVFGKLFFKFILPHLWILLRWCSVFTVFWPKKTPKNYYRPFKWIWDPLNLLGFFKVYNKISGKIVSYVVLWKFSNILKVLFTF